MLYLNGKSKISLICNRAFHTSQIWAKKKSNKAAASPVARLGRPGNNLKGGIVGLANVGKTSFFQALSKSDIGIAANYPFATIDPELAKVIVPSSRFDELCSIYQPKISTPALLNIYDIAGLVRGASKGEGLGNSFLSHIRAVDGLFQIVRAFESEEVEHVEKSVDPVRDLQIINNELRYKDEEYIVAFMEDTEKSLKRNPRDKDLTAAIKTAEKLADWVDMGNLVVKGHWTTEEIPIINKMSLLTAKPSVYVANVSEGDYSSGTNKWFEDIKKWIDEHSPGDRLILMSVEHESHRTETTMSPALSQCVEELRAALELRSFFTCGKSEVREWTFREGALAPEVAGIIHTDFQKTFIQAQIAKIQDLVDVKGDETKLKSSGRLLTKGKDYIVQDGDVINFKAGAARK